jgi:hypothetical protein
MSDREFLKTCAAAIATLSLSALLLSVALVGLIPRFDSRFEDVNWASLDKPLLLTGSDFRPKISGGSLYENTALLVSALKNGEAVLEARVNATAKDHYFARIETEGWHPGLRAFLFWHTLERPDGVFYAEMSLTPGGVNWFNLRANEGWSGTISKVEVGIFGDLRGQEFYLKTFSMHPYGAVPVLKTMISEWMSAFSWQHGSINSYSNTLSGALVPTTVAASALILLVFPVAWALQSALRYLRNTQRAFNNKQELWRTWVTCVILMWLLVWGEWLSHLAVQHQDTMALFWGKTLNERKASDWDADTFDFSTTTKSTILGPETERAVAQSAPRILIIAPGAKQSKDKARRLRYHLLPELLGDPIASFDDQNLSQYLMKTEFVILFPASYEEQTSALKSLEKALSALGRRITVKFRNAEGAVLDTASI